MIKYSKRGVKIAEVWFEEPLLLKGADIVFCLQRKEPVPGAFIREKHTSLISLKRDAEQIFADFSSTCRNEARRAKEKDGVLCKQDLASEVATINRFADFYDAFAAQKQLSPLQRKRLELQASAGMLDLSYALSKEGEVLLWHAHLVGFGRARLLHSASLFREAEDAKIIGRANRYLHWDDMLRFKQLGYELYDFGGWYPGKTDEAKIRINRFKEQFGGYNVCEFDCELPVTFFGQMALRTYRWLNLNA